ncbi:SHC-transforming protein 1-like [Oopsacas minuta]|uniref:SHC-transforming protein 1-like n=1 Tax=Oopsacas minuta TaxID=111878 RepID=A0AAV7KG72_9METZ|nr:SHC-transforming protein 1-like [Oopsacas minuta]
MTNYKPKTIVSDDAIKFEKGYWSSTGSFRNRPDPGWTHDAQDLTGGFGVAYSVMFCGLIEIKKSLSPLNENKRTAIIRESILRVLHYSGIRSLGKKPKKLPKQVVEFIQDGADTSLSMQYVNLIINSEKFLSSYENGKKMLSHVLNDVSFVATGIGNTADYIGYVSRDNSVNRACFVFDCLGNSKHIANTMTQAFEIKLKEVLAKNMQKDLLSSHGMQNGGWADEHLYEEGAGCWNNVSLPPVPPAVFDDNIYDGVRNTPDPLYDNKRGGAAREDQDLYDNRPQAKSLDYSDQGIYDNSIDNSGRKDCESEYDNCPKMEAEDYLEGLLKQNIYDNNVRNKIAARKTDEIIYDNKQDTNISAMLDNKFGSHQYGNIENHKDNIYQSSDPLYDNKSGEEGSDRKIAECVYDNRMSSQIESKPPPQENSNYVETGPAFGESPYDNSPNNPVAIQEDDTYTSMVTLKTPETTELYDNIRCEGKEENLYDLAEVVEESSNPNDIIHRVKDIVIGNEDGKLADLYDTPFETLEQNNKESFQIYDNAVPNEQTDKPSSTNLVPELIYDNNQLVNSNKIEVLSDDDFEFDSNPVYGIPEECLSPSSSRHANFTAENMFSEQLAEPKKLPTTSDEFAEEAVYGESLISNIKPATPSTTKILPINSLPFFHPILSRKDCELLLKQNGDFLIRESQSKKGQYVISGLHLGRYQHLLFLTQDSKIQTKEREFPSVSHLVAHYMKTKELLSTGNNNLSLINPIYASFPDSDIYTMMS